MKFSWITISPAGLDWNTMRNGKMVSGHIEPSLPRDEHGDFVYFGSQPRSSAASRGTPFSDLPDFFNATPKLDKFFRALYQKEFTQRWLGMAFLPPSVAVHLVEYSRQIHLGEKLILKDCILRWGARNAITCERPTRLTESEIYEIMIGGLFEK